jgi:hypothetical protein
MLCHNLQRAKLLLLGGKKKRLGQENKGENNSGLPEF